MTGSSDWGSPSRVHEAATLVIAALLVLLLGMVAILLAGHESPPDEPALATAPQGLAAIAGPR